MKKIDPSEFTTHPLTTPRKNFFEDKFWHHSIHERLGETLFYFLARVRPLDHEEISAHLKKFLQDKRLGSIRVFPIFGSFDLLIRAWLHPSVVNTFRKGLDSILVGSSHTLHTPFSVEHIDKRWYERGQE